MTFTAVRLEPGAELKKSLMDLAKSNAWTAAAIVTCVGSLRSAKLRMADAKHVEELEGPFEIVSLVGTLNRESCHLHIALSDSTGRCVGGHLMDGCRVYTTAEIVLAVMPELVFDREKDPSTGYPELVIKRAPVAGPRKRR